MRDGVRILNVARGPLIVDEDLQAALDSGKVGGAALDVFRSEPVTEHPLFGYPNVVVTPHLGASTAEATDRAGFQAAEQVVAALTGGQRHERGQRPGGRGGGPRGARAVPAAGAAARAARRRAGRGRPRSTASRSSCSGASASATRGRWRSRCCSASCSGHTEEDVNEVNAPAIATERGIELVETPPGAGARLHRPRARDGRLGRAPGARRRHRRRAPAPRAPARGLGPALQPPARRTTSRCSATATCRA